MPTKLKLDKKFQPCHVKGGDEAFRNGIFEFNITRLLAFIEAHAEQFPIEFIAVADIPDYGSSRLDEETVRPADLSRPILLAEIAPGRYNLIDGNHRIAKARRDGAPTVPARKIRCPQHVPFLTSAMAYEKYLEYWNSKLKEMQPTRQHRASAAGLEMRYWRRCGWANFEAPPSVRRSPRSERRRDGEAVDSGKVRDRGVDRASEWLPRRAVGEAPEADRQHFRKSTGIC